jgi:AmmeMemoRadiSam system protein A
MKTKAMIISMACVLLLSCMPSLIFAEEESLSDSDKEALLVLARKTLTRYLKDGALPHVDEQKLSKNLRKNGSCFVTLKKKGSGLRGCIGVFERTSPLYQTVMSRVIAAAIHDSRFPTVTYDELKDIQLDISVLTEPKKLEFSSAESLLQKLQPLKDGVIVKTRFGSSTFLPQVWKQIPDKEQFLYYLCKKHGAPGMIWKKEPEKIQVLIYHAIVFGEEGYGGVTENVK